MKKVIYYIIYTATFLGIGCASKKDEKLSREDAKAAIIQKTNFPYTERRDFARTLVAFADAIDYPKYQQLEQEGMITFAFEGGPAYYSAYFTEQGKQFIAGTERDNGRREGVFLVPVRTCTVDFGEITGIQEFEQMKSAQVTYTIVRKNVTPFGRVIFKLMEGAETKTATFTKFDDGWRIKEER